MAAEWCTYQLSDEVAYAEAIPSAGVPGPPHWFLCSAHYRHVHVGDGIVVEVRPHPKGYVVVETQLVPQRYSDHLIPRMNELAIVDSLEEAEDCIETYIRVLNSDEQGGS